MRFRCAGIFHHWFARNIFLSLPVKKIRKKHWSTLEGKVERYLSVRARCMLIAIPTFEYNTRLRLLRFLFILLSAVLSSAVCVTVHIVYAVYPYPIFDKKISADWGSLYSRNSPCSGQWLKWRVARGSALPTLGWALAAIWTQPDQKLPCPTMTAE